MADYATLLRDHVTLKCRSLDRIFLQAYVPKLQSVGQVPLLVSAAKVQNSLLRRLWQDRRTVRASGPSIACRT